MVNGKISNAAKEMAAIDLGEKLMIQFL